MVVGASANERATAMIEDFHQTGNLLEQRGGYLTLGTGKNSVAQAGPPSAPVPTGNS